MSTLVVEYGALGDVITSANSVVREAEYYIDCLTNQVNGRIDSVNGGPNDVLNSAKYYVGSKINSLRNKANAYRQIAISVSTFSENAKRIDKKVADRIQINKEGFYKENPHLKIDDFKAAYIEFFVGWKNSVPIFEMIGNWSYEADMSRKYMINEVKRWYRLEGGKEIVGLVGAVIGALIAVALFIVTLPASAFVAICAAIGAAIAAINAIYKVYSSARALEYKICDNPAMAKIYSEQSKLSDGLRWHNFGDRRLNMLADKTALQLDATEFFCGAVSLGSGAWKSIGKSRPTVYNVKKFFVNSNNTGAKRFFDQKYIFGNTKELIKKPAEMKNLKYVINESPKGGFFKDKVYRDALGKVLNNTNNIKGGIERTIDYSFHNNYDIESVMIDKNVYTTYDTSISFDLKKEMKNTKLPGIKSWNKASKLFNLNDGQAIKLYENCNKYVGAYDAAAC